VLEHRFLDAKRALYLIEIAGKILVVGSGGEELNLITEITDEDQINRIYERVNTRTNQYQSPDFKNVLSGMTGKTTPEGESPPKAQGPEVFSLGMQSIRTKINKIKQMINER